VLLEVLYQRKYVVAKARRTARNMFGPPDPAHGNERSSAKKKKKHSSDDSKKDEKNKNDSKDSKKDEKNKPNTNE